MALLSDWSNSTLSNPHLPKALRLQALLLWAATRLEEARPIFQELAALAPSDETASSDLFYLLIKLDQVEPALAESERYLSVREAGHKFGCFRDLILDNDTFFRQFLAADWQSDYPRTISLVSSLLMSSASD